MNWAGISQFAGGQEMVFWVAAAAVAAGLTLLIVAIVLQVKRLTIRGLKFGLPRPGLNWQRVPKSPEPKANHDDITVTDTGYTASPSVLAPSVPISAERSARVLVDLLDRLRNAADDLEAFHSLDSPSGVLPQTSGLKPAAENVDYVFRSGVS